MSRRMNSRLLQNVFLMVVMGVCFTSCWNFSFSACVMRRLGVKAHTRFFQELFTRAGLCSWLMKCAASFVCRVMTWGWMDDSEGLCLLSVALVLLHFSKLWDVIETLFLPPKCQISLQVYEKVSGVLSSSALVTLVPFFSLWSACHFHVSIAFVSWYISKFYIHYKQPNCLLKIHLLVWFCVIYTCVIHTIVGAKCSGQA